VVFFSGWTTGNADPPEADTQIVMIN